MCDFLLLQTPPSFEPYLPSKVLFLISLEHHSCPNSKRNHCLCKIPVLTRWQTRENGEYRPPRNSWSRDQLSEKMKTIRRLLQSLLLRYTALNLQAIYLSFRCSFSWYENLFTESWSRDQLLQKAYRCSFAFFKRSQCIRLKIYWILIMLYF